MNSLGVHEHWNNPTDKQYSRDLGAGNGIELIMSDPLSCEGGFGSDGDVDGFDLAVFATDFETGCSGGCDGDLDGDVDVDESDLAIFAADFGRTNCLN